jgi:putative multiple sugar transport system ATP-binding protein
MPDDYILRMKNITKTFPGVAALKAVSLDVKRGEIHAVVGENGAGKSTLMNLLGGVYPFGSYSGDIEYNGQICEFKSVLESEKRGIAVIHQELALIPRLPIYENIFVGNEQAKNGIVNWNECIVKSMELLKRVGLNESPKSRVIDLGIGKQQLVEIAKALSRDTRLLILDEPTSALNDQDSEKLLELLKQLKASGITCIMISHRIGEVVKIADSITILRDGKTVERLNKAEGGTSEDRIIKGMVGREIFDRFPRRNSKIGEKFFEIKNWNVFHDQQPDRKVIDNVNLYIRKGEVVGLAGLMGAGRTELGMSVFGQSYGRNISGEVYINGKAANAKTVSGAIRNGIAYLSEDRKQYGLVMISDIKSNISLVNLDKVSKNGVINTSEEVIQARKGVEALSIKCSSVKQKLMNLSGGNQQKVVFAKWMFRDSDVLILDDPTRGVDVGAKYEIYKLINKFVEEGKCILFISSELPEILGMCDRIYVLSDGKIKGELDKGSMTQESIMKLIVKEGVGDGN